MPKKNKKPRKHKQKFKLKHPGASAPKKVTDIINPSQFDQLVLSGDKPAIVDFWAEWCMPCKATAPHFAAAAETYSDQVTFAKVNTEKSPTLASRYGIRSIPTMLMIDGGEVVDVHTGASQQAGIERMAKKLIARRAKAESKVEGSSESESAPSSSDGLVGKLKGLFGGKKADASASGDAGQAA